jgi:16S rRNA (uracil1498-N3)-methyltransferase
MHRFYIEPGRANDRVLELCEREAHHATRVLRLREGDKAACLDGAGTEFLCVARSIRKNAVSLEVTDRRSIAPLPFQTTLIQAIPKGKTMETIIQKATELGAHRVIPILTERTVVQLEEESAETKLEKWKWIAIDAIKQCGSPWLPEIEKPSKLQPLLDRGLARELNFVGSLHEGAAHPRVFFDEFEKSNGRRAKTISVFVGPEGDFTPLEITQILQKGRARPITLGPLVLRSDTAAIYCLSIISYELQNSG